MCLMFVMKKPCDIDMPPALVGKVGPAADSDEIPIRRWQIRILRKKAPR